MRVFNDFIGQFCGTKIAAQVRIAFQQAINHAVHDRLWHLSAGRVIEVNASCAVVSLGQRRKLRADRLKFE